MLQEIDDQHSIWETKKHDMKLKCKSSQTIGSILKTEIAPTSMKLSFAESPPSKINTNSNIKLNNTLEETSRLNAMNELKRPCQSKLTNNKFELQNSKTTILQDRDSEIECAQKYFNKMNLRREKRAVYKTLKSNYLNSLATADALLDTHKTIFVKMLLLLQQETTCPNVIHKVCLMV